MTVRPYSAWMHEQREGALHEEASEGLNALVEAVMRTGKAGEIAIVVKVKPAGRSQQTVIVSDEVKLKLPQEEREEAIFFVDRDSNLSRQNPLQPELPLREVPRPAAAEDLREAQP